MPDGKSIEGSGKHIMDEISLRPHHILCIRFFEGKGYSRDFTKHMAETIERLREPGKYVVLVDEEDEICRKCPNCLKDGCSQREKVLQYDAGVLHMLDVPYGERMEFIRLWELAEQKIMAAGRFPGICGDCEWASVCHKKEGGPAGN